MHIKFQIEWQYYEINVPFLNENVASQSSQKYLLLLRDISEKLIKFV